VVLCAVAAVLAGCALLVPSDPLDRDPSRAHAEAEVRSAIPAVEAYYADNGTYEGMTLEALHRYDVALSTDLRVGSADASSYCLDFVSNGEAAHTDGPGGQVAGGPCP
jgi:hypothetical protein